MRESTQRASGTSWLKRVSAAWEHKADGGQSLAEFAFMLPLLCLLLVGIAEIGRVAYLSIEVGNGATAGVEYGSQNATTMINTSGMQTAASSESNISGMSASATYGCTCDKGDGTPSESCTYPVPAQSSCASITCSGTIVQCVQVTTQASITPIFHFPGLPTSYSSHGAAVMRVRH